MLCTGNLKLISPPTWDPDSLCRETAALLTMIDLTASPIHITQYTSNINDGSHIYTIRGRPGRS